MSGITKSKKKVAIVLFNLGGPDSEKAVKPFLFNLFFDKHIINLPFIPRFLLAKLISFRREKFAREIYAQVGNKSPILKETQLQMEALKKELSSKMKTDFEIFICMRHWHPLAEETIKNVKSYDPEEIIMLPLYPQFSTTTTASSIEDFTDKLKQNFPKSLRIKAICCYPEEEEFINAHASLIEEKLYAKPDLGNFRILFSAHGLPERIIENGDPYQWQIEKTVFEIVSRLEENPKFKDIDHKITYQSRVGPLKWLGPATEDEIKLAGDPNKSLVIVPVSFVSEHVETLVELDIEYKKIADQYKMEYIRIPALGVNHLFIQSLAKMVLRFEQHQAPCFSSGKLGKICPIIYDKCPATK